ncbi:MAG: SAM-dependent methyltransferase [Streptosporangiaceae bacterium]|jgi:hypothetical protein
MTDEARALDLDTSKPNIARVYDFWLGGKDNFAADRELAAQLLEIDPGIPKQVRENRTFLTSAAARAATDGVTQFLDLGAGLPSHPAVHEAVREVSPDARVAYVDIDPVVVSHAAALLAKGPGLTATRGDVGDPDAVLDDPAVLKVIDLGQPLCVIMAAVLHYLEPERASAAVRRYVERLPVGSWLVISVVHTNDPAAIGRIPLYTAATIRSHSPDDLAAWLAGTELVPPGIAETRRWMSGIGGIPRGSDPPHGLCAVGVKRLLPPEPGPAGTSRFARWPRPPRAGPGRHWPAAGPSRR